MNTFRTDTCYIVMDYVLEKKIQISTVFFPSILTMNRKAYNKKILLHSEWK